MAKTEDLIDVARKTSAELRDIVSRFARGGNLTAQQTQWLQDASDRLDGFDKALDAQAAPAPPVAQKPLPPHHAQPHPSSRHHES